LISNSVIRDEIIVNDFPVPRRDAVDVWIGYPASYRVGMSNLGFHFIYGRFKRNENFSVERFFSDTAPFTLESRKPLSSAAALIFSVSYEDDYLELIKILIASGIDPRRKQREEGPLIIVGGIAVSSNPCPVSEVADVIPVGEGEMVVDSITEGLQEYRPDDRDSMLNYFSGKNGIMVPGVKKNRVTLPGKYLGDNLPGSVITSPLSVFPDTYLVEIARGCPGSCSFCLASVYYNPYRFMPYQSFKERISILGAGVSKVGLISTAVAAHPQFIEIMELLEDKSIFAALSSLRAEDISERKADLIGRAGIRSVALAPESGSEQLRRRLGKNVSDQAYLRVVRWLARRGINNFSFYLMSGIPGEGSSILESQRFIRKVAVESGKAKVTVHLNIMVPKPGTPMQFYAMPPLRDLTKRISELKAVCLESGVRFKAKSARSAIRQALLSLGGAEVGRGLIRYAGGGTSWKRAMEKEGVNLRLPHLSKEKDWEFPYYEVYGTGKKESIFRRFRAVMG
jgi:radical SAM superfamily enzyme YgiQ (UPF0313 family)